MAARVDRAGNVYQLDRRPTPDEPISEDDVQEPTKLVRILGRLARDVAEIKRRFFPRRVDFEDRVVTSGDVLRLPHGFEARVRWWVVDWVPSTPGDVPLFEKLSATDTKTLVLEVGNTGTVSIRLEVAG